jgi:hypothetical protein
MTLRELTNRLPEYRRMKIQEMIFQDTPPPKKKRHTKWQQFNSNAALSLQGWKIGSRRNRTECAVMY